MALSKADIQAIYQLRAKHYDCSVALYGLIGFRNQAYRSRAIDLLHLQQGQCVVELGCGTGLNFPLLIKQIGSTGLLIGVDLRAEILACARARTERSGWRNVELVESDMATYVFPKEVDRVLSTGALGYVTEYDAVIQRARQALVPGGRLVIWDLKKPERWPKWLVQLFFKWLGQPFGVTPSYVTSHPWESVERYFEETTYEERYWGGIDIASGTACGEK